jgi:hypothetical protein
MNNGGTVFGGNGLEALAAGEVPLLPAKASSPALFIIHYSLFIIHYSLFIIHYSLFNNHNVSQHLIETRTDNSGNSPTWPGKPLRAIFPRPELA